MRFASILAELHALGTAASNGHHFSRASLGRLGSMKHIAIFLLGFSALLGTSAGEWAIGWVPN